MPLGAGSAGGRSAARLVRVRGPDLASGTRLIEVSESPVVLGDIRALTLMSDYSVVDPALDHRGWPTSPISRLWVCRKSWSSHCSVGSATSSTTSDTTANPAGTTPPTPPKRETAQCASTLLGLPKVWALSRVAAARTAAILISADPQAQLTKSAGGTPTCANHAAAFERRHRLRHVAGKGRPRRGGAVDDGRGVPATRSV